MTLSRGRLVAIILILLAAIGLGFAGCAYVYIQHESASPPPPPIPSTTTGDPKEEYTPALRQMFPIGSNSRLLTTYLQTHGFEFTGPHEAVYRWQSWPACRYFLIVKWDVDDAGRLTNVQGDAENACL